MGREVQVAVDCADPERLAVFWADVLGYRIGPAPGGFPSWAEFSKAVTAVPGEAWSRVEDPEGIRPTVLFHSVPEPKVGKNRVHLDVGVAPGKTEDDRKPFVDAEVARLVGQGATHVRVGEGYYAVMQDPEGNEFCVGRQRGRDGLRHFQVSVDCQDPDRLAAFWVQVLDYQLAEARGYASWADYSRTVAEYPGEAWCLIIDPDGVGPSMLFHAVPEPRVVKNRVHLDVDVVPRTSKEPRRPLVDAEATRLVAEGAMHVRTDDDEHDYYAVMQDPEGNELCLG